MLDTAPESRPVATAPVTYEVTAVRYASLRASKSELFYRWGSYSEPDAEVEMAYYFWLLRASDGGHVLVDTGFDPEVGERRGRTCLVAPLDALGRLGAEPAATRAVIVSHFHYDHIGNLGAFENVEWIVPRRELDFWTGPRAERAQFAQHVEPNEIARVAAAASRLRLTDGDEEVLPGIEVLTVGGHSPGQQLIRVATAEGDVLLTSDAVHFYEELESDRPFGVIADLAEMYGAYDRIRELAPSSTVVPGHDPEVVERFESSALSEGSAVRLRGPGGSE